MKIHYYSLAFAIAACNPGKLEGEGGDYSVDDFEAGSESGGSESAAPYGPENSWSHATVDEVPEVSDCGVRTGDTVCNFTMVDQFGDDVELYQFSGKVIVLDIYAEW
jgi:hypothetical protein